MLHYSQSSPVPHVVHAATQNKVADYHIHENRKLDAALTSAGRVALGYEVQMKDLEVRSHRLYPSTEARQLTPSHPRFPTRHASASSLALSHR